ncbi:MAG TPA: carbohydrate ABC transporter permease [bacterium]|nr:carbohydrate ABC transporter permease [bacterium]
MRIFGRRSPALALPVLALGVLVTLIPFVLTFLTSIKYQIDILTGAWVFRPTLDNYTHLFFSLQSNFIVNTVNSLVVASVATALVVVVAALAGYSLERFRWPRHTAAIVAGWVLIFHMVPGVTIVGPYYLLFRALGLYDTRLALILSYLVLNLPMAVWIVQSFVGDLPMELEEAAHIDGASNVRTFVQIVAPLIAPGLAAVAILSFVFSWNEFLFALNLTATNAVTIPVGIAKYAQQYVIRYGDMSAAAFFATIPAIIVVVLAQRQIVRGLTLGALK